MKYHFRLQKHSFYHHITIQLSEKGITLDCYLHEIKAQKHGYWRPKAMLLTAKSIANDREFVHILLNMLSTKTL